MKRPLFANALSALAFVAAVAAGLWWTPHPVHEVSCLFALAGPPSTAGRDKLLECSNLEQSFSLPPDGSVRDAEADTPGWRMFIPASGRGTVLVTVRKSPDRVAFYPRLGGEADRVLVYETRGVNRRLLYAQRGAAGGWTPIGRRMALRMDCVENGWSDEEFPVRLEIVLEGKGAQLWHKGGMVFF
jgi:hypothetical protein